ncbi:protein disulfide-isomerase A4-like [Argiope bruennichi]|uniref:protein disulfide-isomerase A4-like n=1 Tax=Argiope bruennichi TaxID=94029 RepID=UPI002493F824|nr:protein disulfide-isomerase A4-like [Argiope bruennichi]
MDFTYILCFFICYLTLPQKTVTEDEIPVVEGDGGVIKTAIEDDVLVLTRENFDIQVMSKDIILVEFYAPWCGHCKSLAPEYAKAAKILKEEENPIFLAKVDATIETELASRYEVTGYPTLYIFKKGEKIEYDGPRTAMGIVEYMKERADPNWKPPPSVVIELTKENFHETVKDADIILVEFYAPWCGHCKRLAPEYERAAKVLNDLPTPIPLAKVNGIDQKELAEEYGASGWPTLFIFRKGRKYSYEGPRDELGIINYMKEQAKPPSEESNSYKHLKNAIGKIDTTVVGFFDSNLDDFYRNFVEAANSLRGKFTFLHSFKTDVRKQLGYQKSTIVLFLPELFHTEYEPKKYDFDNAEASPSEIIDFIQKFSLPLVGERSRKSQWKYNNKFPLVVVYYEVDFSFDHRVQTQLIRKEVAKVAKDYKGKVTFAVSNENEYEDELQTLNLDDSGEDVNVGFFDAKNVKYRMEPVEDFSEEELRTFVEDVLAGNVPKHIRSQPIPKDNKGPVLTVVGKTFDELVTKSKKNVFLEFYAPWCGHCKKLEPIYKKLGKAFADNDDIVIAKIDATSNDYPNDFQVNGFPTLYYVPFDDKSNLVTYEGERNLKEMTKFINEQLSKSNIKDEL